MTPNLQKFLQSIDPLINHKIEKVTRDVEQNNNSEHKLKNLKHWSQLFDKLHQAKMKTAKQIDVKPNRGTGHVSGVL